MLYWVVGVQNPTEEESKKGKMEVVVIQPTLVVANDDKMAAVKAVNSLGADNPLDLDKTTIVVRPF